MVTSFTESVKSIQLSIPGEERLLSKLHDCLDPLQRFYPAARAD